MSIFARFGKQIIGGAIAVAALLGWKFYQRSSSEDETRAQLVALCEADQECHQIVNQHFDACHEQAFRMGNRRHAAELDTQAFVACINSRAGKQVFSAQ